MALEILYAPLFLDKLEKILAFFDERNGNNSYSRNKSLLIVDIYSCLTNPEERDYKKK